VNGGEYKGAGDSLGDFSDTGPGRTCQALKNRLVVKSRNFLTLEPQMTCRSREKIHSMAKPAVGALGQEVTLSGDNRREREKGERAPQLGKERKNDKSGLRVGGGPHERR